VVPVAGAVVVPVAGAVVVIVARAGASAPDQALKR